MNSQCRKRSLAFPRVASSASELPWLIVAFLLLSLPARAIEVTTNLTASITSMSISSNSITLGLGATSRDGRPVLGWHIYRDGVIVGHAINPAYRPDPPELFAIDRTLILVGMTQPGMHLTAMPKPIPLKVFIRPYVVPYGGSNAVITVYKSTWLGTVASPWKPTTIFPATRTNATITVLPGTYFFRATATVQPYGESPPSNVVTNMVSP